jgi:hypothetical protein
MALLGSLGTAALVAAAASCSKSPEAFCQDWVSSTCHSLAGCCQGGAKFDAEECRISLSRTCEEAIPVARIHAGEVSFDSGSATACLASFASCTGVGIQQSPQSFAGQEACANMVTGFLPNGASCTTTSDCQREGAFSTCYFGNQGPTGGICVQAVLDAARCSFSFSTGELHICPDNGFCDKSAFTPNPSALPSSIAYEFSAPCRLDLGAGQMCVANGLNAPCAKGLFCDVMSTGTCVAVGGAGAPCLAPGECGDGLVCTPNGMGTATCMMGASTSQFCVGAGFCGDGVCTLPENPMTCPQDCFHGP